MYITLLLNLLYFQSMFSVYIFTFASSYFCGNHNACFFDALQIQNSITVIYCKFDVF